MDRKTVIALVLILIIFVGWMYLTMPQTQQVVQEPPKVDSLAAKAQTQAPPEEIRPQADTVKSVALPITALDSLFARFDAVPSETVTVETKLYIACFCNRGANLVSFKFKDFAYHNGVTAPVEMLPPWASSALNFRFPKAANKAFDLARIAFSSDKKSLSLTGDSKSDTLAFRARLSENDWIEIAYTFYANRYDFDVRINFEGATNYSLGESYLFGWEPGLEATEKNRQDDFSSFKAHAMWDTGLEKYDKFVHGEIKQSLAGAAKWIDTRTKYFVVGVDPDRGPQGVQIDGEQIKVNQSAGQPGKTRIGVSLEMAILERKNLFDKYSVYIGPIDYEILKSYKNGYEQTVDLGGILKPISLFIIWLIKGLHALFQNYGLVIIVFSILVKVAFYPLTVRSLRSMKKMQELQPKLKALQEKYKKDPQKLNAEIMKLWKENKVNPMGGCLLMLPQLPIFYALFTVFRNTILLRGAGFCFWMKDLSQPDATMILPIIMTVTMFFQQKLSIQDPKQKMMVYFLPIIFFFLFKGFSSGLVLYWTMFNILSVLEIIFIRRPQAVSQPTLSSQ